MPARTAESVPRRISTILKDAATLLRERGWTADYRKGLGVGALSTTGVIRFILDPLRSPFKEKLYGDVMLVLAVELRRRGCKIPGTPERVVQEWSRGPDRDRNTVIGLFHKCRQDLETKEAMKRLTAQIVSALRDAQGKLSSLSERRTYEALTKLADDIERARNPMQLLKGIIPVIISQSRSVGTEEQELINELQRVVREGLKVADAYARG